MLNVKACHSAKWQLRRMLQCLGGEPVGNLRGPVSVFPILNTDCFCFCLPSVRLDPTSIGGRPWVSQKDRVQKVGSDGPTGMDDPLTSLPDCLFLAINDDTIRDHMYQLRDQILKSAQCPPKEPKSPRDLDREALAISESHSDSVLICQYRSFFVLWADLPKPSPCKLTGRLNSARNAIQIDQSLLQRFHFIPFCRRIHR
jgi:hypothetical protein